MFEQRFSLHKGKNDTGSRTELKTLYELAQLVCKGNLGYILEIGTFKGYSTAVLAAPSPQLEVHTIDPYKEIPPHNSIDMWKAKRHAKKMWRKLKIKQRIKHHKKSSQDLAVENLPSTQKIGLLYIDGNHESEEGKPAAALMDYEKFGRYVSNNGYVVFHDYNRDEEAYCVKQAVEEVIKRTRQQPQMCETLAIFSL